MTSSPICVSDSFHFSHYYWKGTITDDSDGEDSQYLTPQPVKAEDIKLKFYAKVLQNENIHFGKWDGIALDAPDAYAKAAEQMTDYMFDLARTNLPHRSDKSDFSFVDLGSGTAASALQIMSQTAGQAFCLNVCHEQNVLAQKRTEEAKLGHKIQVVEGTFEEAPFSDHKFDLAFSQDAFIHALSKKTVYQEAFRMTKPGGAFVFCDLMAGPEMTADELQLFSQHNVINDFLTPEQNRDALHTAGWKNIHWIDLTADMRISFQLMLKKVHFTLEHGHPSDRVLLQQYSQKIKNRIIQIDRGLFKWCVFHARKPVVLDLLCKPPVPFVNTSGLILMNDNDNNDDAVIEPPQDPSIAVVDIITRMPRERIEALPSTVSLLITMSAGLDHIDLTACKEKGIQVRQAGRDAITSHVVQYTLAFIVLGLRNALSQIGVPFPSKGWNLNWNIPGKPLTHSKIAIVGMGIIGQELVRQLRALAPDTDILYFVPEIFRDMDVEAHHNLLYRSSVAEMAAECDILVPLCPLTKHTQNMINADVLGKLQPHAGLLNFARGGVVDTDALTQALEAKQFRYAILDTTAPEPLPQDHPLWSLENCFILPHFATNTLAVREALVSDIQPIIEECFGLGRSDEKLRQQEKALRYDLAVAHRMTAKMNMDMLVWNHISARFQSGCLITPGRKLYSQIKPEDLVFSSTNVTADIIHDAIYTARPDVHAIMHVHTPNAVAVSCLESGFVPLTQDAAYFYEKVANYAWDGVSDDVGEKPHLMQAVRSVPGCNTLLMDNHGVVFFGASVKEVFVLCYYFERACETQLKLLQTGAKIRTPKPEVMRKAAETSYLPEFAPGVCEWDAICDEISF